MESKQICKQSSSQHRTIEQRLPQFELQVTMCWSDFSLFAIEKRASFMALSSIYTREMMIYYNVWNVAYSRMHIASISYASARAWARSKHTFTFRIHRQSINPTFFVCCRIAVDILSLMLPELHTGMFD